MLPRRIMNERLSIGLWNVEWASRTDRGHFFTPRLAGLACDVLCVTEVSTDLFPESGHVITSDADYGYTPKAGRRKVLLWSRAAWSDVDTLGSPLLPPGRFVGGTTSTPLGTIRFIGVCIPWRDAHVRTGHRNRRPWDDHLAYLHGLALLLRQLDPASPVVLLGDFNQRIPRVRQPSHLFDALIEALGPDFRLATESPIVNAPGPSIDHLAVCGPLVSVSTEFVDNLDASGTQMSDHFGLRVSLLSAEVTTTGAREATVSRETSEEAMAGDGSSEQLILEVSAEGGSLSISSLGIEGSPQRFVVRRNEAVLWDLLSEEDAEGTNLSAELGMLHTFDEALRVLGRYPWYRLDPLHAHPRFVDAVLREVTRLGGTERAERWKQILLRDTNGE